MLDHKIMSLFMNGYDIKAHLEVEVLLDDELIYGFYEQLDFGRAYKILWQTELGRRACFHFHDSEHAANLGDYINLCFLKNEIARENLIAVVAKIFGSKVLAYFPEIVVEGHELNDLRIEKN